MSYEYYTHPTPIFELGSRHLHYISHLDGSILMSCLPVKGCFVLAVCLEMFMGLLVFARQDGKRYELVL